MIINRQSQPLFVLLKSTVILISLQWLLAYIWLKSLNSIGNATLLNTLLTALLLIGISLPCSRFIRGLRFIAIAMIADINYTFAAFYGRFVSINEFKLAANNALFELFFSFALYFNWWAVLSSIVTAMVWDYCTQNTSIKLKNRFNLLALILWLVLSGCVKLVNLPTPVIDPLSDYIGSLIHSTARRILAAHEPIIVRDAAPLPTNPSVDFDVIYLVGESLRADRFDKSTYARIVTPTMQSLRLPHVKFSNVISHGDCTGRSVPYLMVEPKLPYHVNLFKQPTLFDYAQQAGFSTSFIYSNENDWQEFVDGHIGYLKRNLELGKGSGQWTFNDDRGMLPFISQRANTPGKQFLVIESYTSHWPYADRYRYCEHCRAYLPDNQGKPAAFAERNRLAITNSYDNALLYFDIFVDQLLKILKKPTLLVFTSDHGESIGEEGRWGHCSTGVEQMQVPLMVIATNAQVANQARFTALSLQQDLPVSHANLFATFLDWFGYSRDKLTQHYPPSLFELTPTTMSDRTVLVSEIGSGSDPVSIAHINSARQMTHIDTNLPHE